MVAEAQVEPTLPVGEHLHDYEIQKVLGTGGFGITYLAVHRTLGFQVAIKEFMPRDFSYRDTNLQIRPHSAQFNDDGSGEIFNYGLDRFLKEAKDLSLFEHPNIIKARNFFEANGTAYIVMDYARGETLKNWLSAQPQAPDESTLKAIFLPLLDGLQEVHAHGLLHRDIKPDNIYIQENGVPLLLDFGTARNAMSSRSKSIHVVIAEGYSPKEQYASAGKQGAWSDIYSVGASLYRSITGKAPAGAMDRSEAFDVNEPDPVQSLVQQYAGKYSTPFLATIDRCLAFNQADRPQSVVDVRLGLLGVNSEASSNDKDRQQSRQQSRQRSNPLSETVIRDPAERIAHSLANFDVSAHYSGQEQFDKSGLGIPDSSKKKSMGKWLIPVIAGVAAVAIGSTVFMLDLDDNLRSGVDEDKQATPGGAVSEGDVAALMIKSEDLGQAIERAGSLIPRGIRTRLADLKKSATDLAEKRQYPETLGVLTSLVDEQTVLLAESPRVYLSGSPATDIRDALNQCAQTLGEDNCAPAWFDNERQRSVELTPFSMDSNEVSYGEFAQFVNKTGHTTRAEQLGYSLQQMPDLHIRKLDGFSWRSPQGQGSEVLTFIDHPVVHVSYGDAQAYCQFHDSRLPTSAEWEYAASGGADVLYASYFSFETFSAPSLDSQLINSVSANDQSIFDPSTRLYGVTGNVWEWTDTTNRNFADGKMKYTKGGSWNEASAVNMRVASLRSEYPGDTYIDLGFRCARDLDIWPG